MDWYYKAGLIVGLAWATARALGAYGEAARELDINFLFGFLLTTGGWAAVFLVIDWVLRFLGLRRKREAPVPSPEVGPEPPVTASVTQPSPARRRRGR